MSSNDYIDAIVGGFIIGIIICVVIILCPSINGANEEDIMGDSVALKPCPFCGENDVYLYQHGDNYGYVECGTCNARFTTTTATCTIDVIDAWNKRADSLLVINGQVIDVAKIKQHITGGGNDNV